MKKVTSQSRGVNADVTRSALLAVLGSSGPATRADLARAVGVSAALVTQHTKALLAEGLVEEGESVAIESGRPGKVLRLTNTERRAVGVKLAPDHVTVVKVALDGTVVSTAEFDFDARSVRVLDELTRVIRLAIGSDERENILGIGIGVPGAVDAQDVGIVDAPSLDWSAMPLGRAMRDALELPVIVENNVNALATAELLYGDTPSDASLLAVTIGSGIGSAFAVGRDVVRGAQGGAGEIAHVPSWLIESDGVVVFGDLEELVSERALLARAARHGVDAGSIEALAEHARGGSAAAHSVFSSAAATLGRVVAGAVSLIDPSTVVLSGEGVRHWDCWNEAFEAAFRSALVPAKRIIPLAVATWTDEGWARGAAALVLATPFDASGVSGRAGMLVRRRLATDSF